MRGGERRRCCLTFCQRRERGREGGSAAFHQTAAAEFFPTDRPTDRQTSRGHAPSLTHSRAGHPCTRRVGVTNNRRKGGRRGGDREFGMQPDVSSDSRGSRVAARPISPFSGTFLRCKAVAAALRPRREYANTAPQQCYFETEASLPPLLRRSPLWARTPHPFAHSSRRIAVVKSEFAERRFRLENRGGSSREWGILCCYLTSKVSPARYRAPIPLFCA